MTSLDSSSGAESSMDETVIKSQKSQKTTPSATAGNSRHYGVSDEEPDTETSAAGDAEVWGNFTDNFRQVQSILDRNRLLIEQVNENHRSKIHENMVKNIALIQEINENVSKVVSLYSNLSTNFSSVFHPRNPPRADGRNRIGEERGD